MSTRALLVSVGLLCVCGEVRAQQPAPQPIPNPGSPLIPPTGLPLPGSSPITLPPIPVEKTVDDLIAELERLHAQKADLEKKEQELKAVLRKRLQLQTERLQKLGVTLKDVKPRAPDRVGRILLEGTAEKDEKKILDVIGIRPGEVLRYPVLEEARIKLEKTGFRDVVVEVVSNKQDAQFKDIRVRVEELKR